MKVNICASLVSLQVFVVGNVRDNVRLQYLQDCCYYGIQEKGNCSRGCILMREGFIFGGWGRGKVRTSIVGIFRRGRECRTFLCMLTFKWMCGENSTGRSLAGRQIKGVGWGRLEVVWSGCHVSYCRM